jgi:uncharacterized protein with von Willebrand factor type A (vWA) domain
MDWKVDAASIVLLLLLLWLLCHWLSKRFQRRRAARQRAQAAAAATAAAQASLAEEARRRQAAEQAAAEQARKVALVERVLRGDPLLVEILCAMAGTGTAHYPLRDTSADRERVLEIARRVNEPILHVLAIAATQSDIDLDLEQQQRQEEVAYPTRYIEPVGMRTLEQVSDVIPEQLLLDDDAFYANLVQQALIVLQPYERRTAHKTLEILWDVSGSMNQVMADGIPRHNWARGIAVSLLLKALKGGATYLVRPFDDRPHPAQRASNPEEAIATIKLILDRGASDGGTNIRAAVRQAITDVHTAESLACGADILILTDGEDPSVDDVENVQAELGPDIRLHVASIGTESPALQAVATTYNVFQ